jgi:hypothetical protein
MTMTNGERVAATLKRESKAVIGNWLARVRLEPKLMATGLSDEKCTEHLAKLLDEVVHRLLNPLPPTSEAASYAAVIHGQVRQSQGYTIPMLVEESRILQVSIFETLKNSQGTVDFNLLMPDVMTIADEVYSQLMQTISSFMTAEKLSAKVPVQADLIAS